MSLGFDNAQLIASSPASNPPHPFITVAIPHYDRRKYLEAVLRSLFEQEYRDFEILISDDHSPDDSSTVIPELLRQSQRSFRYYLQPTNLQYDRNLKFCLQAAQGQYIFLLGNDDVLNDATTLAQVAELLHRFNFPQVALTNFTNYATGVPTRRVTVTRLWKPGVETAIQFYSAFAFVSGIILDRESTQHHATDRWDHSTFYQIYLASRIIASGGNLATFDLCAVRQDVRLNGQPAPNYVQKLEKVPWSFAPRTAALDGILELTADAVLPFAPESQRSSALRRIANKLLIHSYLFWLFEYRRVANWGYAFGMARGLFPSKILKHKNVRFVDTLAVWSLYCILTAAGFFMPLSLLTLIKKIRQPTKPNP